ncbi:MAG: succinate dehydrogenase subunit [Dehalococcoidia bacterium]|nr:succinate dehydrogenase subunit [Dehalococcoidia bacterium]
MAWERWLGYLTACLAMGAIAGRNAAAGLEGVKVPRKAGVVDEGLEEARLVVTGRGKADPGEAGDEIRRVTYRCAGPVRSAASLGEGLRKLDDLTGRAAGFRCGGIAELKDALDAKAMLLAAGAVLKASQVRTESRGGFYRRDFPERNDRDWLRPIMVSYDRASGEVRAEPGEKLVIPK